MSFYIALLTLIANNRLDNAKRVLEHFLTEQHRNIPLYSFTRNQF